MKCSLQHDFTCFVGRFMTPSTSAIYPCSCEPTIECTLYRLLDKHLLSRHQPGEGQAQHARVRRWATPGYSVFFLLY